MNLETGKELVRIAFRRGITVYAASYFALAHLFSCEVFTADQKLVKKTEEEKKGN